MKHTSAYQVSKNALIPPCVAGGGHASRSTSFFVPKSALGTLWKISRTDGVTGLYRGVVPSVFRAGMRLCG